MVLLTFAYWSDRLQKRSPFILAGLLMCLVGFSINISNAPSGPFYCLFCDQRSFKWNSQVSNILASSSASAVPIQHSLELLPGWAITSLVNTNVVSEWPCTLGSGTSREWTDSYEQNFPLTHPAVAPSRAIFTALKTSLVILSDVRSAIYSSRVTPIFFCRRLRAHVRRNWLDHPAHRSCDLQAHQRST